MAINREALCAALFARLQASLSTNIKTYTRTYITSDKLATLTDQPALVLNAEAEEPGNLEQGIPPTWTLHFSIVLFCRSADTTVDNETIFHPLIDLVESALEYRNGEATPQGVARHDCWNTTLGGLCRRAYISGIIEKNEGPAGDQAYVSIPVAIEVTQ